MRRERVDAQHLGHGQYLSAGRGESREILVVEGSVSGAHSVVQHGERLRHGEVVIHGFGELVGYEFDAAAGELRAIEPAIGATEEDLDAV